MVSKGSDNKTRKEEKREVVVVEGRGQDQRTMVIDQGILSPQATVPKVLGTI